MIGSYPESARKLADKCGSESDKKADSFSVSQERYRNGRRKKNEVSHAKIGFACCNWNRMLGYLCPLYSCSLILYPNLSGVQLIIVKDDVEEKFLTRHVPCHLRPLSPPP